MDHPSETSLCTVAPPPQTPLLTIFFWGEGAAVHRLSGTDNSSSNCPSKLADKIRRIVRSKLKPFHFQIKTHYLSDANYQTDNPSHTNGLSTDVCGEATVSGVKTAISVVNEFAPRPWVERSHVCFCFFTKIIYILTVDISMCKIILELEYCIKYDLLNVKIFQKNSLFHPEMILRPLFCFKVRKNTGLLIFSSLKQKK